MEHSVRFGIMGTGFAAQKFAEGLKQVNGAVCLAVASKKLSRAKSFAKRNGIPKFYGSYEELLNSQKINVIYIATYNSNHFKNCLDSLNARKHVLCEKPLTTKSDDSLKIITLAEQNKLFCMEAMWMRFIPLISELKIHIKTHDIGEIIKITGSLGHKVPINNNNRFFSKNLGGGALLDLGCYLISFTQMLWGEPRSVSSNFRYNQKGIDVDGKFSLLFTHKRKAEFNISLKCQLKNNITIHGTKGNLEISAPLYCPQTAIVTKNLFLKDKWPRFKILRYLVRINLPFKGNGYNYEIEHVVNQIRNNLLESSVMPLKDSYIVAKTIDRLKNSSAN